MPNGKPGDYWLTDLIYCNRPAFGEPVDSLIKDIVALGGERMLDDPTWLARLWDAWPAFGRREGQNGMIASLVLPLAELRGRLAAGRPTSDWRE